MLLMIMLGQNGGDGMNTLPLFRTRLMIDSNNRMNPAVMMLMLGQLQDRDSLENESEIFY